MTAPVRSGTNVLSIVAIVFGVIAVVFFPIVFGPLGIVCGAVAISRRESLAKVGLAVAVIGMVVGFALGFAATD